MKVGELYDLYAGLSALDQMELKLAAPTRLKLAVNQNKLASMASAFERARTSAFAENMKKARADNAKAEMPMLLGDPQLQAANMAEDAALRDAEAERVEFKTVLLADLRLDDNPKITARILAQIAPMISDFE